MSKKIVLVGADVAKGQGVGAAHETCADESDTEFAHDGRPFDFYFQKALYGIDIHSGRGARFHA
ncbi:hypothetical protein [Pseudomonas sp. RT6P73]